MFGWLKRQRIREQRKLLYQNRAAAEMFRAFFAENGDAHAVEEMQAIADRVAEIERTWNTTETLIDAAETDRLMKDNRDLRRIRDTTGLKYVLRPFDKEFAPPPGHDT
jgi:hypothetical protein